MAVIFLLMFKKRTADSDSVGPFCDNTRNYASSSEILTSYCKQASLIYRFSESTRHRWVCGGMVYLHKPYTLTSLCGLWMRTRPPVVAHTSDGCFPSKRATVTRPGST